MQYCCNFEVCLVLSLKCCIITFIFIILLSRFSEILWISHFFYTNLSNFLSFRLIVNWLQSINQIVFVWFFNCLSVLLSISAKNTQCELTKLRSILIHQNLFSKIHTHCFWLQWLYKYQIQFPRRGCTTYTSFFILNMKIPTKNNIPLAKLFNRKNSFWFFFCILLKTYPCLNCSN